MNQVAVDFLTFMYPEGPWLLTAIPVERTTESQSPPTRTFYPGDNVSEWLENYAGGGYNFYFSVNRPWSDMSKKASRLEIKEMCFLHVDLDPRVPGPDADKAKHNLDERTRIQDLLTKSLPEGVPEPSALIDSGGGYWAFWRLKEPFPIRREAVQYEEAKLYNLQLETLFGADSCHNVDRIARLPGTINYPDAKKRNKGRVECETSVIYTNENVYDLQTFTKAPQVQAKKDGFSTGRTVKISENVKRLQSLDELPPTVPLQTKTMIAQGYDPDDATAGCYNEQGRSGPLFHVCCELVRQGCDDDLIYAVITDPDWEISSSVIDGTNGRGDGYARRQIERAREFAVDPKLAELNNRYAVVQNTGGGSCRIVYEEEFDGNKIMVLQSPTDFKAFYANQFVTVPAPGGGGGTANRPLGRWWFEHPMRRSYKSIVFLPGQEVGDNVYNMWRGFAYEALPGGSCDLYLKHIRDVICDGAEDLYGYLLNWMAMAVQQPWNPGYTAIVLKGGQGSGKGTFAKTFAKLFGRHGKQITDPKHLTGHFNNHLRDCVVMFADEAVAAASNEQESMLKALVTEESMMVTPKGKEASPERNYLHVIMASNADWVIPVGQDDRRFVVLDVADAYIDDPKYWKALNKELNAGGYQALLYLLATRDLSGFDVRSKPRTSALQEQKIHSFSATSKWWHDVLQNGMIGEVILTNGALIPSGLVTYDHRLFVGPHRPSSTHHVYRFLKEASIERRQASTKDVEDGTMKGDPVHAQTGQPQDTARPNCFVLPTLEEMRKSFDETHGGPYTWEPAPEPQEEIDEPF